MGGYDPNNGFLNLPMGGPDPNNGFTNLPMGGSELQITGSLSQSMGG